MQDYNIKDVIIITNDFHIPRAELAACVNKINAYPMPAEDLIKDNFPQREADIDEFYRNNPAMLFLFRKEKWAILESILDPYGYVPTFIKKFVQEQDFEEMYYNILGFLRLAFS